MLCLLEKNVCKDKRNAYLSKFLCECGKTFNAPMYTILSGHKRSCGCLKLKGNNLKHGYSKTNMSEYHTWKRMKMRCYNKNNPKYKNYGARGITVCDRWLNSFENFYADMGSKPGPKYSIDRINNDGNYTPENCRWATDLQQANNKTNITLITYKGKTQSIAAWGRELGISPYTISTRIIQRNWTVEKAFNKK